MSFVRNLVAFVCMIPAVAGASPVELYAKAQTGGYAGLATVGVGLEAFERHARAEVLYGFVPAAFAGMPQHIVGFKTDAALSATTWGWVPAYLGGGLLYNLSSRVFARLPEEYPEKYYPSTALHWEAHLGTEMRFGKHGAYIEANMHELAWLAMFDNPGYFGVQDVLTYTVGYKYSF